jgi:DNA ligase (NAD+)
VTRLVHFASRHAFDIGGIGPETAERLVEHGLVQTPADLFRLEPQRLIGMNGFAMRSATQLVQRIRDRRQVELERFIYALGLPGIGRSAARSLAQAFPSLAALRQARLARLARVPRLGPSGAAAVRAFFADPSNRRALDALLRAGVHPTRS